MQNKIEQEFEKKKKEILEATFSIGSTYVTPENTNPNTILGFGTWERLKGKVAVGLDEDDEDGYFDEIGKEGGEKKHTQTINEMPKHNHSLPQTASVKSASGLLESWTYVYDDRYPQATGDTGSGKPMNITQPYRVVGYMWIRTA